MLAQGLQYLAGFEGQSVLSGTLHCPVSELGRVLAASCSASFELVSGGAGNQGDGQSFVSFGNVHKTIQIQN